MSDSLSSRVDDLVDAARRLPWDTDDDVVECARAATRIRALGDHLLALSANHSERLGTARRSGMRTAELLTRNGCAPAVAARAMRVGRGISVLDTTARYSTDALLSGEHVAAVVAGVHHVATRCQAAIDSDLIANLESRLVSAAISGAAPAEIANTARGYAIEHTPPIDDADPDTIPIAEDSSLNEFSYTPADDGRLRGHFDLDIITGERLIAGLDSGSRPRPLPDGTPDPRTAGQRRADAFRQLLESGVKAMASTAFAGPSKTEVLVTIPADTTSTDPVPSATSAAHLQWLGPISTLTTTLLTCDAVTSVLTYDEHGAPVTITDPQRLFAGPQRTAVANRDKGCIKCGAPCSWGDIHHIIHHADGGFTVVDNGCVLCRSCHVDVHHRGWDVVMGHDRHPWLRPPVSVDPQRTLMPSYHRRTMNLTSIAA